MNNKLIFAVIILIIIIVVYLDSINSSAYDDYLEGFWIASEEYCEDSDIDSMLIYIGKPDSSLTVKRNAYIVIMDVCNQDFTISYRRGWAGPFISEYKIHADTEFGETDIMPKNVTITVDVLKGIMKIHSDGVLYGVLYKQHDITDWLDEK